MPLPYRPARSTGLGSGCRGLLGNPAAAVIAVDTNGREITDPSELRAEFAQPSGDKLQQRIAFRSGRDRLHQMCDLAQFRQKFLAEWAAVEDEGLDVSCRKFQRLVGRPDGAGDPVAFGFKGFGDRLARIATSEDHHIHHAAPASRHSSRTSGSSSAPRTSANREKSSSVISRFRAHIAMPRTTGEGHPQVRDIGR